MAGSKILLITSEFPPNVGGIGNHAFSLATALSQEGFQVTVQADIINVSNSDLKDFSFKQPFIINWIVRKKNVVATYLQRILNAYKTSYKVEVIICSGKFSLWLGAFIRFFHSNKKLIAVVHGSELDMKSTVGKWITSKSLCKFNHIISVSTYTQGYLPNNLPKAIGRYVIPNGIYVSEFLKSNSKLLIGEPALITIGSVTERKGQLNVINALPAILSKFPKATYHIVGKPVIKEVLQQRMVELKVKEQVHFYGAVSRHELISLLGGGKIKMMLSSHTSRGDFEGFGIAVLEANALGIPAIGSKNSGIVDAIDNFKTGILVDPRNEVEIVNAIEKILSDYEFYSTNAIEWAKKHDWTRIIKQYKEVLETN